MAGSVKKCRLTPNFPAVVNFADATDSATGDFGYGLSQVLFKPEPGYVYDSSKKPESHPERHRIGGYYMTTTDSMGNPQQIWIPFIRSVRDHHEALPMIAKSKGKTIAHEVGARGVVVSNVNMALNYDFDDEHGGAFDRSIQNQLNDLYDELLRRFQIPFNE